MAAAEDLKTACILLDLNLPGKESGIEVLRALIGDEYPPKRRVIILTVLDWDSLREGSLSFGASAFLVKGQTDAVALNQTIRQVTGHGISRYAAKAGRVAGLVHLSYDLHRVTRVGVLDEALQTYLRTLWKTPSSGRHLMRPRPVNLPAAISTVSTVSSLLAPIAHFLL